MLVLATSISGASNISLSFLPVYFTSLGGTVLQYGVITTAATLIGIPMTMAGGSISGIFNIKKIAVLTSLIGPTTILGYYLSCSWLVLSIPILAGSSAALGSTALRQIVADATVEKKRTTQISLYQTLTSIPSMFSPLVGGFFVHSFGAVDGFRDGAIVSLAMAPVSTLLLLRFLSDKYHVPASPKEHAGYQKTSHPIGRAVCHARNFWSSINGLPRSLIPLLLAFVLVIMATSTTGPYLIFYSMSVAKLNSLQWGLILSLQLLFANLVRTPLGILSDRFEKRKVLFLSVTSTAPLSALLLMDHSFMWVLGIMLATVATGVCYGPTHEALQIEMTPRQNRPALFAIYDVLRNLSVSAGTFIGALLFTANYALPFFTFTALELSAGGIIACTFFGNKLRKDQTMAASQ